MKDKLTHIYIRQKWRVMFRLRRARLYWRHYDRELGWLWRIANAGFAVVLFAGFVAIPVLSNLWQQNRYQLDADTIKLVGNTDSSLASLLTYNGPQQEYIFNQKGLTQAADPSNPTQALMKAQAASSQSSSVLYALQVPQDMSKGVSYTDTNTGLSFSLVPQFSSTEGQDVSGHLVFPLNGGQQAIYTLKNNGLKEDIVVPFATSDTMTFSYKLNLPDTLEAKIIPGTGDVGVYSADPSLFGNISYGSDADQQKVMKARQSSPKNHLVFGLPAPLIKAANGNTGKASAKFVLKGNRLDVVASGLGSIRGSFSVDPSVVITSSSDFASGNNEDNISFGTSDQISRGSLTGGSISGGWSTATTAGAFTSVREGQQAVAYNGYIYVLGGDNHSSTTYNDVQYAPISNNGTIGAWSNANTSTSFTNGRDAFGASAYNGYLYVYGGSSGSTLYGDVQYASINANGTLGNWTTATASMVYPRSAFGSTIYQGYLYVFGGCGSNPLSCNGFLNSVEYAPLNANGSVGSFTVSGNTFTNGRLDTAAVIYNGYAYVLGGYYYAGGNVELNDVQYAPVKSDGSIGTWVATTSFTTGRAGHDVAVYGGYLYISAGYGASSNLSDTQYAPINANGSIGTWTASASVPSVREYASMVAYNGYLYFLGGYDGTADHNDVQYAKIDPAGIAGQYVTSGNTFTTGRRGGQTVVYNSYIYELGGDAGSTPVNTVYKAAINGDGTIGSFSSTSSFTSNRTFFAAVAYNGYMYVMGGCSSTLSSCTTASNNLATVYMATINSDGTLGTFSNTNMTSFTTARYGLSAVAYNGYMYIMGGFNGSTIKNDIQYHAISASDGTMNGSWTTSGTNMPASLAAFGAVAYNGYLYIGGGCNTGSLTACTLRYQAVYSAPLSSSGGLSAGFTGIGNFTNNRFGLGMVIANNYLYIIGGGGSTGVYYGDTQYAQLASGGALASDAGCGSTWCSTNSSLATNRYGIGAAAYQGYIYVTGGYNGTSYYNNVQSAPINNGGLGVLGTLNNSAHTFTTSRDSGMTIAYNGYLYVMGGENGFTTNLSDIQYAPISNTGDVGTWVTNATGLPSSICGGVAEAYNGYLYILEGTSGTITSGSNYCYTSGGNASPSYTYTVINSDGSISNNWQTGNMYTDGTLFNHGVNFGAATIYNGYMYFMGGNWCSNSCDTNITQYAKINSDGTLGTWTSSTALPVNTEAGSVVAAAGYIYYIGGYAAAVDQNTVYYASLDPSTGAIGTWKQTTSLPYTSSYSLGVAYNGKIYLAVNGFSVVASIAAGGGVGPWIIHGLGNHDSASGAIYNGYFYMLGGWDGAADNNNVSYAPIYAIPRVAHYSKMIPLGVGAQVHSISYTGTLPGATDAISYRSAGSNGVFGSATNALYTVGGDGGSGVACSGGGGGATQYIWVFVTLDDSSGTTFPDTPVANVQDITVNFSANTGHPAPSIRLRGGATLQNGSLSGLDICGGTAVASGLSDPSLGQNLMGQWDFTGNMNDSSGNGNNGTNQGSATLTTGISGQANTAYSFNGSSQWMSTTNSVANPQTFSINTWFKTTSTAGGVLAGFGDNGVTAPNNYDRILWMNTSGQVKFGTYDGSNQHVVSSLNPYNDGQWHMATAMISSGGMALYVDGVLQWTDANTVSQNYTGWWRIGEDKMTGWDSSSQYFSGSLDDIKIYSTALSSSQVGELYALGGGGTPSPSVIDSTFGTSNFNTAHTVTSSSGTRVGDLLLLTAQVEPANEASGSATYGTITGPSGFTAVSGSPWNTNDTNITTQNTERMYMWYGYATANGAQTYTISSTASDYMTFGMTVIHKGATSGNPFADTPSVAIQGLGSKTTSPATSLTTGAAKSLVLWITADWDGVSYTLPSGYASAGSSAAAGQGSELSIGAKLYPTAGATGTIQGTSSGSTNGAISALISLRWP